MTVLADVEAGSKWFQDVFGLRSGHGGPSNEMLTDGDELVAQLPDALEITTISAAQGP